MSEFTELVDGIIHEPTQTAGHGLDLTVANIYVVETPGRVDFGGGELEDASVSPHEREKRNPDDDYEWWNLDAGTYLIEYNESLVGGTRVTVQPREAVLERGVSHPTIRVSSLPRVPLTVGGAGLKIKENARLSTVVDSAPTQNA
ncbi:dCTP deaminase [Halovenus rubra]|uniref:dCTP deaminase n=2 Tax=Halovenus rubra TaxID=869890 RepID=A0ACC7DZJ3_9EURY|nr:dCTP deaminase [Halovenus rubra]